MQLETDSTRRGAIWQPRFRQTGWSRILGQMFILLSLLILALGGMVDSIFDLHAAHTVTRNRACRSTWKISVDSDGLPSPPLRPNARRAEPPKCRSTTTACDPRRQDGRQSTVDRSKTRAGRGGAPAPGASRKRRRARAAPKLPQVTVPPGMLSAPDKVAEAVESAGANRRHRSGAGRHQVGRAGPQSRRDGSPPPPWPRSGPNSTSR